jgi:hypothetical protein
MKASRALILVTLLATLAATGLLAAAAPRSALGVVSYFPLRVGNSWEYQRTVGGETTTWRVEVTEQSDAGPWRSAYALAGYFSGPPRWVRSEPGGLVMERGGEGRRDLLWYLLGAPVGMIWQLQLAPSPSASPLPDCVDGAWLKLASRGEVIKVPAGEFGNVVRIDFRTRCVDAGIVSEWFAPGVGLIRRDETSFAGTVTSELVRAELGEVVVPRLAYTTALALDRPRYTANLMPPVDPSQFPRAQATFMLSNLTGEPIELSFTGCKSFTAVVTNEAGAVVLTATGDDGGCCECDDVVKVTLRRGVLALPASFALVTDRGEPLPDGHYAITATLDTLAAEPLRPLARALIELTSVH